MAVFHTPLYWLWCATHVLYILKHRTIDHELEIDISHVGKPQGPIWLIHWCGVTHICVGKLINIGSDNGLSPGRRQAIIWTNAGILFNGPWGTNFSEILIGIHTFSLKKIHLKMSSAKWRPFCLGLNVLTLIPVGLSKHTNYKVWYESTYLFSNFSGFTVEVWGWKNYLNPHFTMYVITYPCWN